MKESYGEGVASLYDSTGNRATANGSTYGTSGSAAVQQSVYVYDGDEVVLQFDKTGDGSLAATDLSHRYLWNPQAVDQLFADEQLSPLPPGEGQGEGFDLSSPGDVLWALTDHLNTVRDLATYNSGTDTTTVATHRVFDAYGRQTSSTGTATCLFAYTGKLFDTQTQLQNNLNRWYDASTGRWISEDPIGYDGGINLYGYCENDPITFFDPAGLAIYISPIRTLEPVTDANGNVVTDRNGNIVTKAGKVDETRTRAFVGEVVAALGAICPCVTVGATKVGDKYLVTATPNDDYSSCVQSHVAGCTVLMDLITSSGSRNDVTIKYSSDKTAGHGVAGHGRVIIWNPKWRGVTEAPGQTALIVLAHELIHAWDQQWILGSDGLWHQRVSPKDRSTPIAPGVSR